MRNLLVEFRKILESGGFYVCALLTIVLLFATQVYTDNLTENRYSVISAFLSYDSEERLKHYELCNIMVMQSAKNGWIRLFIPIITAFCFVPQICTEHNANAVRFQIVRSTKMKFCLSRYFSGIISGGCAVAFGYAFFCGAVFFLFPSVSEYGSSEALMLDNVNFYFALSQFEFWLYGMFWSMPAMFCTSVLRNKYLIMCIPFFIKYAIGQTVQRLSQNAFADINNVDGRMLKFTSIVNPDGLLWVIDNPLGRWILLLFVVFSVVFFVAFMLVEMKRGDMGV